jgi:hypothetical protein
MDPRTEADADRTFDALEREATDQGPHDPEQEHPIQDAHGGSMAPGLVDDTGHPTGDAGDA